MKKEVGLWIDHRQAVIVTCADRQESVKRVESHLEKRVRFSGVGHPRNGDLYLETTEDGRDRHFEDLLNHYYDDIIADLRDASTILILGPGEAKTELRKRLDLHRLGERVVAVKPMDKRTDEQIAAEVRTYFREISPG